MKIVVDVNLAVRWADMLSVQGIEAVYWTDVGEGDASDTEIMAWAERNGYTVLTGDLDFGAILTATQQSKPSVVQIRAEDTRPEGLIDLTVGVLARLKTDIEAGALITIDPRKTRIHLLPIIR
ncbi:MAG: DUF5615 family PIN-like protein [Spirochaetia bacterium]|nr:DUF5615 family PIN-like protein [Spirochaetia bacterium]